MDFLRRTWAEIDTDALKHNFDVVKKKANGTKVMAVVKADGYGHGADIVVPVLDSCGASAFAVSNINEAIKVRELGVKKPLLILGYTPEDMAKTLACYDISQCVYDKTYAENLSSNAKKNGVKVKIHIKLDTGMGRIGFDARSDSLLGIEDALYSAKLDNLILEGVFTHFADADRTETDEDGFTDKQYRHFINGVNKLKAAGLTFLYAHCCNSAALCLDKNKHLDMCRAGIILYGLTPNKELNLGKEFIPVMTLKSTVSMVKTLKKGETVNYGRTYKASKDIKVATVAVGYADGYSRLLSNKGYVLINGKKAPIIGRICMDQMSVDVTGIDTQVGDEVILFGKDLPVEDVADICGTINYETVCAVSARVPRITK